MQDDFDYRFSSEVFDTETGLVYYNYRYYSAELGRWLNRDLIDNKPWGALAYGMRCGGNPFVVRGLGRCSAGQMNPYLYRPCYVSRLIGRGRSMDYEQVDPPDEAGWFTGNWYKGKHTIICNGKGDLVVSLTGKKYKYGILDCTKQHEEQHVADWKARYGNDVCKGRKKGDLPYFVPPGKGKYKDFLKKSECDAWKITEKCRKDALKKCCNKKCEAYVKPLVEFAEKQVKKYCK
jgi:RHS repeat-associated protein